MPRRLFRTFVLALSLSLTVSALPVVAQTAYAVTGLNQLVRFNLATPHHFALPPGAYTAIVEGSGGGTGVAVVAVYEVGGT